MTIRGAAMLGMSDRIGSLAPGKQADIAVMSLGPLAMWPVHDAVATVVMQGSGARVRDVLVAGRFAKRDGKLRRRDLATIRTKLAALDGMIAQSVRILYGGSVKASNARELFSMPGLSAEVVPSARFADQRSA